MNRERAEQLGIADGDWVWIKSAIGRVKGRVRLMDGVNPDTVWTWNAIGRRGGAAALDPDAPEATRGFLLNHLIAELLPEREGGYRFSNSDPITGQAAWYDLRVSIEKAAADEAERDRRRGSSRSPLRPEAALMTSLPRTSTEKKLGLVIDLDTCVGCQACATSCKEWNAGGYSAPLTDQDPHGGDPHGTWLNRVHSYEVGDGADSRTVHFPRSCLHCETPACVTVCPTGASYKRAADGIVLVNPDTCIGCKLCSWACPYGAREYDYDDGVMKKCTLCVDRIYNETMAPEDRIPACVRACPTGRAAFRRSRRSAERGVAPGRGARRLRSAAGDRLQAGQQVSAAAPAPGSRRRIAAPSSAGRAALPGLQGRSVLRLGRQDAVALNRRAMHPAYSVIVFTTASGAGYGLLIWLSPAWRSASCRATPPLGLVGLGLALALITIGLLVSTLHLGRPERAWRAFSQWRSSWLSREGVAALVDLPAGRRARARLGVRRGRAGPDRRRARGSRCAVALVTLWCTGMIYASLPTIRAWHQPLVAPIYVVLALATGGVLLCALLSAFGHDARWAAGATASGARRRMATEGALLVGDRSRRQRTYHRRGRDRPRRGLGTVRPLDPPHTQPNFVMREMGYQVARRHAAKLRRLVGGAAVCRCRSRRRCLLLARRCRNAVKLALAVVAAVLSADDRRPDRALAVLRRGGARRRALLSRWDRMRNCAMKQDKIGIAVVGAGRIGTLRARLAAKHPSVRFLAISDRDPARAKALAEQAGADLHTGSNEEIIAHPDVTAR